MRLPLPYAEKLLNQWMEGYSCQFIATPGKTLILQFRELTRQDSFTIAGIPKSSLTSEGSLRQLCQDLKQEFAIILAEARR
ncbi:hypothetical protein D3C76_381800 [compost metagenome]